MKDHTYKCRDCKTEYSAEHIEKEFVYLCPKCGKAEKNKPLKGVLTVEYDYEKIRKELTKEKFLQLVPGKFWLYPQLLPLRNDLTNEKTLQRLALPVDQYLKYEYHNYMIYIMDETRNPTFSYKDRASALVALKAMELGINEIAAASTGNAGSSLAGICARLGLSSHIFVPKNIPDAKRIQIQSFGANIYLVDGDYDKAFDLCLEISVGKKWYNRNTAYNPLTIEGKKTAVYDMFIYTHGKMPDNIFVPVGDGVIIGGIFKGLKELLALGWIEKLPKLIAVQAKGSDALVRFINNGNFNYMSAKTIADSISAGAPRNLFMAAEAVKECNGITLAVTDREILTAQKEMANNFGILSEPSSASVFAAYKNLIRENKISPNDKNMLLITGNGLKDISALEKWNTIPIVKDYDEWKDEFSK